MPGTTPLQRSFIFAVATIFLFKLNNTGFGYKMKLWFGSRDPLKMSGFGKALFSCFSSSVLYFYVFTVHSCKVNNGEHIHYKTKPFPLTHGKQLLTTNTKSSHPPTDSQQLLPSSLWLATTATMHLCNSRTNSTFNQTRFGQAVIESPSAAPARRPSPFWQLPFWSQLLKLLIEPI